MAQVPLVGLERAVLLLLVRQPRLAPLVLGAFHKILHDHGRLVQLLCCLSLLNKIVQLLNRPAILFLTTPISVPALARLVNSLLDHLAEPLQRFPIDHLHLVLAELLQERLLVDAVEEAGHRLLIGIPWRIIDERPHRRRPPPVLLPRHRLQAHPILSLPFRTLHVYHFLLTINPPVLNFFKIVIGAYKTPIDK